MRGAKTKAMGRALALQTPGSPAPTSRAATRAALCVLLAGLAAAASACCVLDGTCAAPLAGGDAGPVPASGDTAFTTAGCEVSTIAESADGSVCATCSDVDICGAPDVARCESRENAEGAPCRFCATPTGAILYDSCTAAAVDAANCEPTPADPTTGLAQGDVQCQTCTDARGAVVDTVCEPAHDECHEVQDQGLTCRECTRDGAVVIHDCGQPDLEPRSCEVYQNDAGRCVDCYDDNDQLLSHSCSLTSDELVTCSESVTADGVRCTACVDQNGAQLEHFCDTQVPELQQCARLDYTDQTCIVCVDQFDQPAAVRCDANTCEPAADGTCASPPPCAFETGPNGQLCRTCPVAGGGAETRCVVDTNLVCENVSGTVGGDPNQPSSTCVSCSDLQTGAEVYFRCDGDAGPAPPPVCAASGGTDPNAPSTGGCEVCSDPETNQDIYATCNGQTCYALGTFHITGLNGNALFLDGQPAVSTCTECAAATDAAAPSAINDACTLRDDCGAVDLTAPQPFCSSTVVFTLLPHACDNPWDGANTATNGGVDELNRILAFALEQRGIGVVAIDDVGVPNGTACAACNCGRGDRIELAVRPADAVAVGDSFGPVLERCSADSDCRSGGACRVDGSCTVP